LKRKFFSKSGLLFCGIIFIIVLGLIIWLAPFFWHRSKLSYNQRNYEFAQLQAEIDWLRLHGGFLAKSTVINDADIWLKLNLGQTKGLDEALIDQKDDKHLFWRFLLKIQQNELREAQEILNKITDNCQNLLGQGLLALAAGKPQETIDLWENKTDEFKHLTKSNLTLYHLAMAQAEIALNELDLAKKELQYAQKLEPKNPACLTIAFEIALKTRDWNKAVTISKMTKNENPIYLTEKALLALQLKDSDLLESTLSELKFQTTELNYINYIKGIQALSQGNLDLGKSFLSNTVRNGLDGILMADVQQALAETKMRLNSETGLQPIIMGNGE
jgi:predicted Zn-dependent protease